MSCRSAYNVNMKNIMGSLLKGFVVSTLVLAAVQGFAQSVDEPTGGSMMLPSRLLELQAEAQKQGLELYFQLSEFELDDELPEQASCYQLDHDLAVERIESELAGTFLPVVEVAKEFAQELKGRGSEIQVCFLKSAQSSFVHVGAVDGEAALSVEVYNLQKQF